MGMYPEATAQIQIERTNGPLDTVRHEYAWLPMFGSEEAGEIVRVGYPVADIDEDCRIGDIVTLGPYRLRVIAPYDYVSMAAYAMRDGWKARAYGLWYRAAGPLRRTYQRLIVTAAVWGLARFQLHVEPSWCDLHIVRWWQGKR